MKKTETTVETPSNGKGNKPRRKVGLYVLGAIVLYIVLICIFGEAVVPQKIWDIGVTLFEMIKA